MCRDFMRQAIQIMGYNKISSIQLATSLYFLPRQIFVQNLNFKMNNEHGHGFYGSNIPKPFSDCVSCTYI